MESSPEACTLSSAPVQRLTVWRKSLLFNGHGYTVYNDADGSIVFRVDDYAHDWRRHTLLMDRHGNVLFTVRRCRCRCNILNLRESWKAYKGDEEAQMTKGERLRPLFKATKYLGSSNCTVSMFAEQGSLRSSSLSYRMSWSREREWFKIYQTAPNTLVAEASRKYGSSTPKKLLDKDVLTLRVCPGMDQALAMAMIMITNSMR